MTRIYSTSADDSTDNYHFKRNENERIAAVFYNPLIENRPNLWNYYVFGNLFNVKTSVYLYSVYTVIVTFHDSIQY